MLSHDYAIVAKHYALTDKTGFEAFLHFRRLGAEDRRAMGAALIRAGFPYHTVAFMERLSRQ